MIPSTLATLAAVLSALATTNGAIIQRQATFTYVTPQPTLGGGATTSSTTTSSAPTTTSSTVPTSPSSTASISSTQTSRPTSSVPVTPTTTSGTVSIPIIPSKTPSVTVSVPITQSIASSVPSVIPTGGAVSCDGVQDWQAAFAYTAGARVIFNGQLYTAKQWTYNNSPPAHPDQWTLGGTCTQPINNKADCRGISAWQNNAAYTAGNRVTFQGSLWSAVQWTYANSPGDASGSWQNLGVCA